MDEYIKREDLYQTLEHRYKYSSGAAHKAYGIAVDAVLNATAEDVVEVVRCKDCKHREKCNLMTDDDFCSDGKRKEGAE